ncbi:hypothetical protein N7527_003679 [Penicillium freii]|nr:hypothetical protein N7527_003679 [Penicillium freii]
MSLLNDDPAPIALTSMQSFNTISGLVQCLESGAGTGGFTMLREAAAYVETCLRRMGLKRSILMKDAK